MLTAYGALVVTLMVLFYALEHRSPWFTFAFAWSCLASSLYGFLAGTWPFGVVEVIWGAVAFHRWRRRWVDLLATGKTFLPDVADPDGSGSSHRPEHNRCQRRSTIDPLAPFGN